MAKITSIQAFVIQIGPRGGKFYYNASGRKVYGTPPTPKAPKAPKPAPAPRVKKAQGVRKAIEKVKAASAGRFKLEKHMPLRGNAEYFTDEIKKVVKKGNFDKLLVKHPLMSIGFDEHRAGTGGCYRLSTAQLHVNPGMIYTSKDYKIPSEQKQGMPSAHNVGWTKGDGFAQPIDKQRIGTRAHVMTHELSHHMHNILVKQAIGANDKDPVFARSSAIYTGPDGVRLKATNPTLQSRQASDLHARIVERWENARNTKSAVSWYAITNHLEFFAETHTAYVDHHDELKANRPNDYALIRDVRKHLGME